MFHVQIEQSLPISGVTQSILGKSSLSTLSKSKRATGTRGISLHALLADTRGIFLHAL